MKGAVRFWIRWNGDAVRLTMRPGQGFELFASQATEEGWERTHESYTCWDDGAVLCRYLTEARDCDGRTSHGGCVVLLPGNAQAGTLDEAGFWWPLWTDEGHWNRDHAAEAEGY